MSVYIKKTSVVLGHIVCIFILIYSFATNREVVKGEQFTEQEQFVTQVPTQIPESTLTPTIVPTETLIPMPSSISKPTITLMPTVSPEPVVTLTPTEIPEPIATLTPTETPKPIATLAPTETPEPTATLTPTVTPIPVVNQEETREEVKAGVLKKITENDYASLDNKSDNWWFRRKTNHVPSGSGEFFKITEYQGFYLNTAATEEDKVVYLTLDCGYGSSNTGVILDVFKKHEIKATFFVTGNYLKACPEEVKRMVAEGHSVGNHSVSHADLTKLTDEEIYREIIGCEEKFYEITGTQMAPYFRPPEGAYSKRTMQITEDLGYKTIFWSIAYNDYDKKNQPGKEYVLNHFETYHHNGAIPLMHNDSDSNMEAMDEVISFLKEQGYRFGILDELGQ
ncbi:MAG: polysaccharide deacetylase family protein [Lachnospiraceae bacterium]|nr:polysaccharide deacetylase family protein [Lachnospiraceae bacterium]